MQSGDDRRNFFQLLSASCFGRLNLKATRKEASGRDKMLRNALKGSVGRLLEAPRFSQAVISNRDLTWKGRGSETPVAEAPSDDIAALGAGDEASAGSAFDKDWSAVGYDPKYRTIRRLSSQEELRFVALAKAGDRFAQQKLILHHLPLLKMIARRYAGKGLALSELVNEGIFGMVRAIERFDMARELRFGTYAKWWIRDSVEQALLKQSRMIRLPAHIVRGMREQQRNEAAEMRDSGEDAPAGTDGEDMQHEMQHDGVERNFDEASWDERSEDKNDGADETTPEMILDDKQRRQVLMNGLAQLSDRERLVLIRRFGLQGEDPETLEEVAADIGVSCERVRQIQKTALTKLKAYIGPHYASAMC